MKYTTFDENSFRRSVDKAVEQVQTILGTTKKPRLAAEEDHTYEDKYALAEFVTNSSIASLLHVLDRLGLDAEKLQVLLKWVNDDKKTVTLSFRAQDSCVFLKETLVDHFFIPRLQYETTEISSTGEVSSKTTSEARVVKKLKQHHWNVGVNYAIAAYPGTDSSSAMELQSRSTTTVIVTSGGMANDFGSPISTTPKSSQWIPEHTVHKPVEINITWLLDNLNREAGVCQFSIDRTVASCRTPRRNQQVDAALDFQHSLQQWVNEVSEFFVERVEKGILQKHNPLHPEQEGSREPSLEQGYRQSQAIYKPIVPLMENGSVLGDADTGALLEAHSQSIHQSCLGVSQMFPSSQQPKLATTAEATLLLLCNHAYDLVSQYQNSINYVEGMLTKQLVQAIGKEVKSSDFDKFISFHNQRLFGPAFAPKPFTYAIRRPNHYPDGILSIEPAGGFANSNNETMDTSIETMVRHVPGKDNPPIFIPINSATSIEITGDRFLHGWIQHRFESSGKAVQYHLVARARQFSSFLLVVGNMAGKNKFSPKSAIILQNKDHVLIPLLTEVLPTAKEFKDAIVSLSPEQQAFARAYRGMQLESSVFGVCVIQLKPQLEKLLNLTEGALTKEIKLTQDLMSLFVDYQIPSDLLSFGGDAAASMEDKLEAVRGHVKAVMDVIDGEKENQIMEAERKQEMSEVVECSTFRHQKKAWESQSVHAEFVVPASARFGAKASSSFAASARLGQVAFGGSSPAPSAPSSGLFASINADASSAEQPLRSGGRWSMPQQIQLEQPVQSYMPTRKTTDSVMEQMEQPSGNLSVDTDTANNNHNGVAESDDFTLIPKTLDARVEKLDADHSLKSTIVKASPSLWVRERQENLLSKAQKTTLDSDTITSEKNKAFDLLDAISRSGTLPIECAELHVVVALTHCFENDVMGTIIQDNINPIEKVERSYLIVGSTIHDEPSQILLQEQQGENASNIGRLETTFPALFLDDE
ncbi:hypothetical protein ACA910_001276 [Epithemia clementina (nom. ined.)]